MKDSKLFCCYSIPLKDFLKSKGLRYEIKAKNITTDCKFWVYMRNEQLNKALDEWRLGKNA